MGCGHMYGSARRFIFGSRVHVPSRGIWSWSYVHIPSRLAGTSHEHHIRVRVQQLAIRTVMNVCRQT